MVLVYSRLPICVSNVQRNSDIKHDIVRKYVKGCMTVGNGFKQTAYLTLSGMTLDEMTSFETRLGEKTFVQNKVMRRRLMQK